MTESSTLPASLTSPLKYQPTPTQIRNMLSELLECTTPSVETVLGTINLMGRIAAIYQFTPETWRRCLVGCYALSLVQRPPDTFKEISGATGIAVSVLQKIEGDLKQCLDSEFVCEADSTA